MKPELRGSDAVHRRTPGPPPDASPFLGDWRNTALDSRGIRRALIHIKDERVWVSVWWPDPAKGQTSATDCHTVAAEGPGLGFFQEDRPDIELGMTAALQDGSDLVMNVKHGVLVIACYRRSPTGPGRYAREFYRPVLDSPAKTDEGPLLGEWTNVRADSPAIRRLQIEGSGRVTALVPELCGEALSLHRSHARWASSGPETTPSGMLADFNVKEAELRITANLNRGLLVVLMQWIPESGFGWFHREFFARSEAQ